MTNDNTNPPLNFAPGAIQINPEKKPKRWLVPAIIGVGALIVGILIGTAGAGGDKDEAAVPAPTVTVTTTEMVTDDTCKNVAIELHSILSGMTNDVAIPQNEVIMTLVSNLQYGTNVSEIQAATAKIQGVTAATEGFTSRLGAATADFAECTQ